MSPYSKNSALPEVADPFKPDRSREERSATAAELKLKRGRDASQAMRELEAARQETLAKTARLRSERLARNADKIPAIKLPTAKSKKK